MHTIKLPTAFTVRADPEKVRAKIKPLSLQPPPYAVRCKLRAMTLAVGRKSKRSV